MDSPSSADALREAAPRHPGPQDPGRRPWLTPGRIVALLGLGVAAAALAFGARTYAGLPELCTFHAMTGLPCPTCGITRSFAATAHGHLVEAFRYHLFGPPAFAAILGSSLWAFTGKPFPRIKPWMAWTVAGLILAYGIARMAGAFPQP